MSEIEQDVQQSIKEVENKVEQIAGLVEKLLQGKTASWNEITSAFGHDASFRHFTNEQDMANFDFDKMGINDFTINDKSTNQPVQVSQKTIDNVKKENQSIIDKLQKVLDNMQKEVTTPLHNQETQQQIFDSYTKNVDLYKQMLNDISAQSNGVVDLGTGNITPGTKTYKDVKDRIIPGSQLTVDEFLKENPLNNGKQFADNQNLDEMIYDLSGDYKIALDRIDVFKEQMQPIAGMDQATVDDNMFPDPDNENKSQTKVRPEAQRTTVGDIDSKEALRQKKLGAQNKIKEAHLDRAEQSKIVKFCDQQIQLVQDATKDMPDGTGKDKILAQLATVQKNKQKALDNIQLDTAKIKTQKDVLQQIGNEAVHENFIDPVKQSFQHAHSTLSELGQNISDSGYVAVQSVGNFIADRNAAFQTWRQDNKDQKAINNFMKDNYSDIGEQSRSAYRVADLNQIKFEKESIKQLEKDLVNVKKEAKMALEKRNLKNNIKLDIKKFFARGDKYEQLNNQSAERSEFTSKELDAIRAVEGSIDQSHQRIVDRLDAYIESAQISLEKSKELENSFGGRKTEKIMGFKDSRDLANKDLQHDINQAKDEIKKEMELDPKVQSRTTERTR